MKNSDMVKVTPQLIKELIAEEKYKLRYDINIKNHLREKKRKDLLKLMEVILTYKQFKGR